MAREGDRLVLCYHAVSERWPEKFSVTPAALEQHVTHLLRHGYRGTTFEGALAAAPGERVVAVTFDDAYRSVHELALPLLERLGVPATVFAITRLAETGAPVDVALGDWAGTEHEPELRSMTWAELRTLAGRGWEVGSHTRTHAKLSTLPDAELADELAGSREDVARGMGRPCGSLAYPYGDFDARVARAAAAAGYERAATLFPGAPRDPRPLEWPRVGINQHHTPRAVRIKTSATVRALRTDGPVARALDAAMRLRGGTPAARPERS